MEENNYLSIFSDEFQNLDPQKISKIFLKDGTIFELNNNLNNLDINKYEDKSFNRNMKKNYLYPNNEDNSKIKKFNSFSAKIRYKSKHDSDANNGFYVTPILNIPRRIIKIKVPNDQLTDLGKKNYRIESFTFQSSPRKYYCKPYKQPKRKNNLIPVYDQKRKNNNICKCPGCIKNKRY